MTDASPSESRPESGSLRTPPDTTSSPMVIEDAESGDAWTFDIDFLNSSWTCVWGDGCQGVHDTPTPELGEGCCSLGAEMLDADEAMLVSALAGCIDPDRFENVAAAEADGIFASAANEHTAVVNGACIFFNRPGFPGGAGCALHLEAVAQGEAPMDWKPSVCWQLPLKVERREDDAGRSVALLRRWQRSDWGSGGAAMAWCCTEEPDAFVGDRPMIESLGAEIEALVGHEVYVELRGRLSPAPPT